MNFFFELILILLAILAMNVILYSLTFFNKPNSSENISVKCRAHPLWQVQARRLRCIALAWRGKPAAPWASRATTSIAQCMRRMPAVLMRTSVRHRIPPRRIPTVWWLTERRIATRLHRWIRVARAHIPMLFKLWFLLLNPDGWRRLAGVRF